MSFTPLNGHIVIRELDAERQTRGGIILPDTAQKRSQKGIVLFVWESYRDPENPIEWIKCKVQPGDLVLFPKYEGEIFHFGSTEVMILKDSCLRGIFRDDPESNGHAVHQVESLVSPAIET